MKVCTKCKQEKIETEYHVDGRTVGGFGLNAKNALIRKLVIGRLMGVTRKPVRTIERNLEPR